MREAISWARSPERCVEGAVIAEAVEVIESGKPRTLEFGVADETAWEVGLSCGGRISVYVEKVA
jgi:xanthine/CO dehydrogenase XdhC/CoxF family maturation factor